MKMPTKTINTETAKRFSAWLANWIKTNKYTQLQGAVLLGMAPGHLNQILSGRSAASIFHMEKIAATVDLDLIDLLVEGRNLLAGKTHTAIEITAGISSELLEGLSNDDKELLRKARDILQTKDEDAEFLKQALKRIE
jgi:transcriptional regulator with XRE-family HTH domain